MARIWRDEPWLVPALVLTALLTGFSLAFMDSPETVSAALTLLPLWMTAVGGAVCVLAVLLVLRMMAAKIENPVAECLRLLRENIATLLFLAFAMLLAGINMIAFMWTKPLLNDLLPFWADPMLARADAVLFGPDPGKALEWLNTPFMILFYHRGWFALMVVTLVLVLVQRPSPRKSGLMLTYFLLWSVAGPVGHALMPSGGPIFYERLGYGTQFAHFGDNPIVAKGADYLWTLYSAGKFGPGAGISAMPSLHIATIGWMVLAVWLFARKWTVPMAVTGFVIFVQSVSLGWHYVVDGIVGAMLAVGIFALAQRYYARPARTMTPALEPA